MRSMKKFLASVAVTALLALPAAAQDAPTADTVVATVNGTEITVGHLIVARQALPQQYQRLPDATLLPALIDQVVDQTVLAQSLVEPDTRTMLNLETQDRSVRAGVVLSRVVGSAVTEEAIEAYYEENYLSADLGPEFNASHILVATEEDAQTVVAELEAGAEFDQLARDRSTGPSAPNGGNLGWFVEGQMVAPFEEAVMVLEPGEVSAPVETQFGWHVIVLNDRRNREAPPIDTVRDSIISELQGNAIQEEVSRLRQAADIVVQTDGIDAAALSDLSLLD
jgi:peptidyl-prolyl cis-trans isomerase C